MVPKLENEEFVEWEFCGVIEERCLGNKEYVVLFKKAFRTEEEALDFKNRLFNLPSVNE